MLARPNRPVPGPLSPTLAACAALWLARVRVTRKPRTHEGYADVLRLHVLPGLGPTTLVRDVTRAAVEALLLAKLAAGYSGGGVRRMQRVLSALLTFALEHGDVDRNVALGLGRLLPVRKGPRPAQRAVAPAELADVLATVADRHPAFGVATLVAARTGLRLGEVLGLQWRDVDLRHATLVVQRSVDWRYRALAPKGNNAETAPLPLAPDALAALRRHHGHRVPGILWVFPGPSGRPWSRTWLRAVLVRACADAGVRAITPHALRHTFATMLDQTGAHPLLIRDLLRHTSVVETEDYIARLDRRGARRAVGRLTVRRRRRR